MFNIMPSAYNSFTSFFSRSKEKDSNNEINLEVNSHKLKDQFNKNGGYSRTEKAVQTENLDRVLLMENELKNCEDDNLSLKEWIKELEEEIYRKTNDRKEIEQRLGVELRNNYKISEENAKLNNRNRELEEENISLKKEIKKSKIDIDREKVLSAMNKGNDETKIARLQKKVMMGHEVGIKNANIMQGYITHHEKLKRKVHFLEEKEREFIHILNYKISEIKCLKGHIQILKKEICSSKKLSSFENPELSLLEKNEELERTIKELREGKDKKILELKREVTSLREALGSPGQPPNTFQN